MCKPQNHFKHMSMVLNTFVHNVCAMDYAYLWVHEISNKYKTDQFLKCRQKNKILSISESIQFLE